MARKRSKHSEERTSVAETNGGSAGKNPRSLPIAAKGIRTGADFACLMSALMSDLIEGRVTPQTGNATCNAGGKLLKIVEMQYKYGTQAGNTGKRTLTLALEEVCDSPLVAV